MRPTVLMIMSASVDGRITTGPGRNVDEWSVRWPDRGAPQLLRTWLDRWGVDGVMSGSESVLIWSAHPAAAPAADHQSEPWPWPYIVFDGRGRITWGQTAGLIVVTRANVANAYRQQLGRQGIDTVWAGTGEHIDVGDALDQLYRRGFRRLALNGGGRLNGVFLSARWVDELLVAWEPVLVGGVTTPTIYDAADLASPTSMIALERLGAGPGPGGSVWGHYHVLDPQIDNMSFER